MAQTPNQKDDFLFYERRRTINSVLVWSRINNIREEIKNLDSEFERFIEEIGQWASKIWSDLEQEALSSIQRDSAKQRLERWKKHASIIRAQSLERLTNEWYERFWFLRSEIELLIATFRYGLPSQIICRDFEWEQQIAEEFQPIRMQISYPRKPRKMVISKISYDIQEEIRKMMIPISQSILFVGEKLSGIRIPKQFLEMEESLLEKVMDSRFTPSDFDNVHSFYADEMTKNRLEKVYKHLFLIREEITKVTQASASRGS